MAKKKAKKRAPKIEKVEEGFAIGRSFEEVKPPTKKELDAMRQRDIIRRNPHGTA